GLDEARALLTRASLSSADIPDGVVAELLQRCAGNPLVLREFAESLSDGQLCGRQPLPRQLVLGPRSLEVFRRSWAALPERCRRWLLLLSLGPESFPVCLRAAQLLGLELADLAPAERAGVGRAADAPRWSSPLERIAVQQAANREETALVCAALAEAVDAAEWPVEHARYLAGALTDPDRAATALAAAAVPMAQTGQLLEAYEAAQQAAALSTDTAKRERYRIVTAELAWLAGYCDHALDLLDRAAPQRSADARTSATIIRAVIRGFTDSCTSWWRLLPEEVHHEPGSAEHAFRLLVTAITAGWENASVPALQQAVARLRSTVAPPLELSPGVMAALERVVAGHSDLDREERRAQRPGPGGAPGAARLGVVGATVGRVAPQGVAAAAAADVPRGGGALRGAVRRTAAQRAGAGRAQHSGSAAAQAVQRAAGGGPVGPRVGQRRQRRSAGRRVGPPRPAPADHAVLDRNSTRL